MKKNRFDVKFSVLTAFTFEPRLWQHFFLLLHKRASFPLIGCKVSGVHLIICHGRKNLKRSTWKQRLRFCQKWALPVLILVQLMQVLAGDELRHSLAGRCEWLEMTFVIVWQVAVKDSVLCVLTVTRERALSNLRGVERNHGTLGLKGAQTCFLADHVFCCDSSGEMVRGYDFLVNAVWPEIVINLEARTPSIFAPGNPEVFHQVRCRFRCHFFSHSGFLLQALARANSWILTSVPFDCTRWP